MPSRTRLAVIPTAALAVACLSPFAPAAAADSTADSTVLLHSQLCAKSDSSPSADDMTLVLDTTEDVIPGIAAVRELSYDISGTDRVCDLVLLSFTAPAGSTISGQTVLIREATIAFDDDPEGLDTMTQPRRSSSKFFLNDKLSDLDTYRTAGQEVTLPAGTRLIGVDNYAPVATGVVPIDPQIDPAWRGRAYVETSLPAKWTVDIDVDAPQDILVPKTSDEIAKAQATLDRAIATATAVRTQSVTAAGTAQSAAVNAAREARKAAVKAANKARATKLKKVATKPRAKKKAATNAAAKQHARAVKKARGGYQGVVSTQKAEFATATAVADRIFDAAKTKADGAFASATTPKTTTRYEEVGAGKLAGSVDRVPSPPAP